MQFAYYTRISHILVATSSWHWLMVDMMPIAEENMPFAASLLRICHLYFNDNWNSFGCISHILVATSSWHWLMVSIWCQLQRKICHLLPASWECAICILTYNWNSFGCISHISHSECKNSLCTGDARFRQIQVRRAINFLTNIRNLCWLCHTIAEQQWSDYSVVPCCQWQNRL